MMDDVETGVAHVWIVPFDVAVEEVALDELLSQRERERCDRLYDADARRRFVRARFALRTVLGALLGRDPAGLVFVRGPRGKPAVEGATGIDFSFSDCRDCALIAVAAAATGVDGEHERVLRHEGRTARRIFHRDTVASLERLPAHERTAAFLTAWTQREAHVKAVGGGLFHTADVLPFDPLLPADARPRIVTERGAATAWSLARFRPSAATLATLAVRGALDALTIHRVASHGHDLHFTETTRHDRP